MAKALVLSPSRSDHTSMPSSGLGGNTGANTEGAPTLGGRTSTGGAATGGTSSNSGSGGGPAGGDATTGGTVSGGAPGAGGTTGSNATGGRSTAGGASGLGGGAQGGSGTGGTNATVGGRTATGGAAAGGANTGGTGGPATGGAAAGGANSGGTVSGGATAAQPQLVTSSSGAYWVTTGTITQVATGNATVTVNDSSAAQTWEGFGGAFNEKGWNYLQMLSQADRDKAMQLLFGADGCRFAMGRIPMGASDYAMERFTYDEVASGSTDNTMASFSITRDSQYILPYVKAALTVKPDIRLWASPWTPPTWMKTGPFQAGATGSPFDGGKMTDTDSVLKANAQYFVKFVQAYAQQGITIEAVAPQNEPSYGEYYPSCLWTPALFTKFVGQYLGPAFDTAGLSANIMLGTMSKNSSGDELIVSAVMADATAKKYIKLLGYQWTMKANVAAAKSYNLPIWQTEHQCGNYPWATGYVSTAAPNDQAYGVESWGLIRDWIKAGATAYSAWNMVLDTVGQSIDANTNWKQNALLAINTSSKMLVLTPTYHVFRHLSQFVDPGAKVVATTGGDAVAFKNPNGSIVAVMYNSGAAATYTVSVGGKLLQFNMPSNGWATVIK
jgi:glucosylceramidase